MLPDVGPIWIVAYWLVVGAALVVSVLAAIVLVLDYRDARAVEEPRRSAIRSRLAQLPRHPK